MTRAVLWVVPLAAVLGALAARTLGDVGVAVALGVGGVAALGLYAAQATRVRGFARRVTRWAGDGPDPVEPSGGREWRELGSAVNVLGRQLREARAEAAALEPWAERLVAAVDVPALLFGPDSRLRAANAEADRVFGGIDRTGRPPTALRVLGSAPLATLVERARDGMPARVQTALGDLELRVSATALGDDVLVLATDRSQQRRVQELRRDFVTNASHELKTPVTSIATLASALHVAPEDRRQRLLDQLESESERLVRLVHDLLDLRRIEADEGDEDLTTVDLVGLVRAAVEGVRVPATERGITLRCELPDRAVVTGREHDLRLVVDNLVGNAVQYNRDGGEVVLRLAPDRGQRVLTVSDTGIGIARQEVPRIFERFYRVDVARSRQYGGTGLGLSIVRHAVEQHGGTIEVDSLLGEGTTFTVRLPVEAPA